MKLPIQMATKSHEKLHAACVVLIVVICGVFWFRGGIVTALRTTVGEVQIAALDQPLAADDIANLGRLGTPGSELELAIDIEFLVLDDSGHINLMQTEPGNDGLRIEVSNGVMAAIVANRATPETPSVLALPDFLERNRWYTLRVEARDGEYVRAGLDGQVPSIYVGDVHLGGSDVRIGIGFDDTRKFDGEVRRARIEYAELAPRRVIKWLILGSIGVLAVGLGAAVWASLGQPLMGAARWLRLFYRHRQLVRVQSSRRARAAFEPSLWLSMGVLALLGAAAYFGLSHYFVSRVPSVLADLLPGYAQTTAEGTIKFEVLAFVIFQLLFAASCAIAWFLFVMIGRIPQIRPTRWIAWLFAAVGIILTISASSQILEIHFGLATLLMIIGAALSFNRIRTVLEFLISCIFLLLRRMRLPRPITKAPHRSRHWKTSLLMACLAFGLIVTLLWPGGMAWYPTTLPNDYYEIGDTFQIQGGATPITFPRSQIRSCILQIADDATCPVDADLIQSFLETSNWQNATGRLLYHHSYIFVPAKHFLTYGLDRSVPYLYGYGDTIVYALLMASAGGTLSGYFATYPLALLIGLLVIAACVGYGARSYWLAITAFCLCLNYLYSIDFMSAFIAASFSPLRYAGLCLQIASIFFVLRGPPIRVAALPVAAAASLFWNLEFAVFGLIGQCLILLTPHLRIALAVRLGWLASIAGVFVAFYLLARPSPDIIATIFLGFFQINMPVLGGGEIGLLFKNMIVLQALAVVATVLFSPPERAARLAIIPVVALSYIKAIFNPSPPHIAITLAFMWPMALMLVPCLTWPAQSAWNKMIGTGAKIVVTLVVAISCWGAGQIYLTQAQVFRQFFTAPFVTAPWSSLGETVPIVTPERPIADRVDAITSQLGPSDHLLLLTPFDQVLSFYVNPRRYCGHFEVVSNIAMGVNIDQLMACVERSENVLVVYDKALELPCPDLSSLNLPIQCSAKWAAKGNVKSAFERLLPQLREVARSGDLVFYRKAGEPQVPLQKQ